MPDSITSITQHLDDIANERTPLTGSCPTCDARACPEHVCPNDVDPKVWIARARYTSRGYFDNPLTQETV